MSEISIVPYTQAMNEGALRVEVLCPQGDSLTLRFIRSTFQKRSDAYERSLILCAMHEGEVVGVAAGAEKEVMFHGSAIRALYGYDLRVHPGFRKFGTARRLSMAVIEHFGRSIDCSYTFVAGQNSRALGHNRKSMGSSVTIPMTYYIVPVYRPFKKKREFADISMNDLHSLYIKNTPGIDFVPTLNREQMIGYVRSITDGSTAGASIWTNENILAEQVIRVPRRFTMVRAMNRLLSHIVPLPKFPAIGDTIKSWFLFDLFADSTASTRELLMAASTSALAQGKDFLYVLLQDNDPKVAMLQQSGLRYTTIPYNFLARGPQIPNSADRVYVDIRDL
jgi:GNAT superfamily N-acetyltransferase